ncbi:MAG: DUF4231 domain-containing protein [Actinomycetota bacterium]|nr:DUF4231 domain-containing protein [Actinomycetota bacterium]
MSHPGQLPRAHHADDGQPGTRIHKLLILTGLSTLLSSSRAGEAPRPSGGGRETRALHRSTAEALKREKYLYLAAAGPTAPVQVESRSAPPTISYSMVAVLTPSVGPE